MYIVTLKGIKVGTFQDIHEAYESMEDLLVEYKESDIKLTIS